MNARVEEFLVNTAVCIPLQAAWAWWFDWGVGPYLLSLWTAVCVSMIVGVLRRRFEVKE